MWYLHVSFWSTIMPRCFGYDISYLIYHMSHIMSYIIHDKSYNEYDIIIDTQNDLYNKYRIIV